MNLSFIKDKFKVSETHLKPLSSFCLAQRYFWSGKIPILMNVIIYTLSWVAAAAASCLKKASLKKKKKTERKRNDCFIFCQMKKNMCNIFKVKVLSKS